jgi:hypothetical protein
MRWNAEEFERHVVRIVTRFFRQHGQDCNEGAAAQLAAALNRVVGERGLPRALAPSEQGTPGGMPEEECAALVAKVVPQPGDALWTDVARQLVKACFYPEFKVCRDSFREVSRDGVCRRQQLERARGRISGSHCVDCPHWVALAPAEHELFLRREWCGDASEFAAHREVFLPEDFRALRRCLFAAARA